MKTLIISGSYRAYWKITSPNQTTLMVDYDLTIFGQHDNDHKITCISNFQLTESCYEKMIEFCRHKYCSWFECHHENDNRITVMENLIDISQHISTAINLEKISIEQINDIRESFTNC